MLRIGVRPATTPRRVPILHDAVADHDRTCIKRMWCRLNDRGRITTRYDKLAGNFLSASYLVAILAYWANSGPTLIVRALARACE